VEKLFLMEYRLQTTSMEGWKHQSLCRSVEKLGLDSDIETASACSLRCISLGLNWKHRTSCMPCNRSEFD
jgi:hypothetical protein